MIDTLLTHTVEVLAPTSVTNRAGVSSPSWVSPTVVATAPGAVQGNSSGEDLVNRDASEWQGRLFLLPGVPVSPSHRVRVTTTQGVTTYEVVGPARVVFDHRSGVAHHLEVDVRKVDG